MENKSLLLCTVDCPQPPFSLLYLIGLLLPMTDIPFLLQHFIKGFLFVF